MLELDAVECQRFQPIDRDGLCRARLRLQRQNLLEILERSLGLAISIDHIAQFLQWPENEERVDEQREELPHADALREDQIEHQEQDRSPQHVDERSLDKAQTAKVADLFQ